MAERKKRAPRRPLLAGVTENGVEIAPGVFRPAPPPQETNPFLRALPEGRTWGWVCTAPGCGQSRAKKLWTEETARTSYTRHRERKHP